MRPPEVDRVAASRAAVAARRARAAVKNDLVSGERDATSVVRAGLENPQSPEAGLRVRELLVSLPGLGPVRAEATMKALAIAESKRVGGLGRHQQERLIQYLGARFGERGERRSRSVGDSAQSSAGSSTSGSAVGSTGGSAVDSAGGSATGSTGGSAAGSPTQTRLVVLAGPTAVGKGTVSTYIRENYPEVRLSVSATTRAPRPGEVDGVSYYFVTDEQFDRMVAEGEFLEWAIVHNQSRYGTPRSPVVEAMESGRSVLLEIDIQGARQVRASMPEAVLVFLLPPTWEELVRRLVGRGTESAEEQSRRLATAKVELAAQNEFDFRVVNNKVEDAAAEVVDLMNIP